MVLALTEQQRKKIIAMDNIWASTICLWSEGLEYVLVGVFCSSAIVSKSIRIASFHQWLLTDVWICMSNI